jgi:two-component system sensor histidine kinase KdpD
MQPGLDGHPVEVEVPEQLPPIELDYIEIDEVLGNLLANAAKYSPPGSPIEVKVAQKSDRILVMVTDRGPGIPDAALERVFEPFYRVPGSKARGMGLGLAVAKGLVEAHGGCISARNRPEGGAEISFYLPASASSDVSHDG